MTGCVDVFLLAVRRLTNTMTLIVIWPAGGSAAAYRVLTEDESAVDTPADNFGGVNDSYPAHQVVYPSTYEPWQLSTSMLGNPVVGLGALTGMLSLLLAFLSVRLRRLNHRLKLRDRQIETLSLTDHLTGLANRRQLIHTGNQLLAQPTAGAITLLYLNIDRFKTVNDELGYGAGDELLRAIGERLAVHAPQTQTLARIGGDEFVLLSIDTAASDISQIAQRVLNSLSQPFCIQNRVVNISASVGIAQSVLSDRSASDQSVLDQSASEHVLNSQQLAPAARPPGSLNFSDLLTQADIAMSKAKTVHRVDYVNSRTNRRQHEQSQYVVFHPAMQAEAIAEVELQRALAQALDRDELRVHYQPIVDLRNSRPVGFEALVRWQHPQYGLLFPGDFLPLAEEIGLAIAIDRWVMQMACQQLAVWRSHASWQPSISVNLTGAHLTAPGLVDYIQRLLSCYSIAPHQLNVEVTESVMIVDSDKAINALQRIKSLGLRVSLDDFGTGYSSLCYLHQLPADVIKIDQSFVRCLGDRTCQPAGSLVRRSVPQSCLLPNQHEVIITAILDMAAELNIRVVAEGIERHDQLQQLQKMCCSHGQGNLFSKPIEAADAYALLAWPEARPYLKNLLKK